MGWMLSSSCWAPTLNSIFSYQRQRNNKNKTPNESLAELQQKFPTCKLKEKPKKICPNANASFPDSTILCGLHQVWQVIALGTSMGMVLTTSPANQSLGCHTPWDLHLTCSTPWGKPPDKTWFICVKYLEVPATACQELGINTWDAIKSK